MNLDTELKEPGVKIESANDATKITVPWFNYRNLVFPFLFLIVIIVIGSQIFSPKEQISTSATLIAMLIFAASLYQVSILILNKTEVKMNRNELSVFHQPLPWLGCKKLPAFNIDSFYYEQSMDMLSQYIQIFGNARQRRNQMPNFIYPVYARMKDGNFLKICAPGKESDAIHVADMLNAKLNETGKGYERAY